MKSIYTRINEKWYEAIKYGEYDYNNNKYVNGFILKNLLNGFDKKFIETDEEIIKVLEQMEEVEIIHVFDEKERKEIYYFKRA